MVSRVVSCWLVVLILMPFSAPFSTCDLQSLLHGVRRDVATSASQHHPLHTPTLVEHAATTTALLNNRLVPRHHRTDLEVRTVMPMPMAAQIRGIHGRSRPRAGGTPLRPPLRI